jgi:hypothetical protein
MQNHFDLEIRTIRNANGSFNAESYKNGRHIKGNYHLKNVNSQSVEALAMKLQTKYNFNDYIKILGPAAKDI